MTPMTPTISVVMPVYNRFELLKYSVESVLKQTVPITEVILVDDGSFDGTSELLPRHIQKNPLWGERVRYFHQQNQGPQVARNVGIEQARSEWLAFNDNDDLWLPQKLEWQFRALDQFKECGACISDAWFMNNPQMKMTLFQLAGKRHQGTMGVIPDALTYMLDRNSTQGIHPVWLQNLIARTEIVRRAGGFDPAFRFGDDDDFAFWLGCETKFCYVNMPMVLIDRTPTQRHVGASKNWDDEDFQLRMAQGRMEKRLRKSEGLPVNIRKMIRRDLAAVHSGWANWYLERAEYGKARESLNEASRLYITPERWAKKALARFVPKLARKAVALRERRRSNNGFGNE